jgi:Fe-S cluster assembly ATP-binding protein
MTEKNNILLEIENLNAQYVNPHNQTEKIDILNGINLTVYKGKTHAIMGPNGSGKSTLSAVIMGHPHYQVTDGDIRFKNSETGKMESIIDLPTHERAKKGIFMSFQNPVAVPGLPVTQFLRSSLQNIRKQDITVKDFRKELRTNMDHLQMNPDLMKRYLNEGFSGGEKKRMEILQLALIQPQVAILDEIDSGLDIDALRQVSEGINRLVNEERAFVLITHYKRLLEYINPDSVHILSAGRIIKEGGPELVDILEEKGYEEIVKEALVNK